MLKKIAIPISFFLNFFLFLFGQFWLFNQFASGDTTKELIFSGGYEMKRFLLLALLCVLTLSLCACSMCAQPQTTTPVTTPAATPATTTPEPSSVVTMPTIDSNIPDPSVDTSTSGMEDMLPTDGMMDNEGDVPADSTPSSSGTQESNRSRRRGY